MIEIRNVSHFREMLLRLVNLFEETKNNGGEYSREEIKNKKKKKKKET